MFCRLALGSIGLGPKYHLGFVKPDGRMMQEVARLLSTGQLKAVVAKTFPLEEAAYVFGWNADWFDWKHVLACTRLSSIVCLPFLLVQQAFVLHAVTIACIYSFIAAHVA